MGKEGKNVIDVYDNFLPVCAVILEKKENLVQSLDGLPSLSIRSICRNINE